MFDEFISRIKNLIISRVTILTLIFLGLGGILVYRCFDLQIVHGEEYQEEFVLKIERTRDIASSRGRILDRNGKELAYNELAYSVKLEDVYESGMRSSAKSRQMNENIYRLIKLIEKNGDDVISDFDVILDEDGVFQYKSEGRTLLRFLADVYGHALIDDLEEDERDATAEELMQHLGKEFLIGDYETEGDTDSPFIAGKGYTRKEFLQLVTIRYALKLVGFRKYVGVIVARDVNPRTVAVIMENSDELKGVTIEEDTVRRYVDSEYFAHLLGYTGKISSESLESLNAAEAAAGGDPERYDINDVVGKGGIEESMESFLQGEKGSETVVVDVMGKTLEVKNRIEPVAGDDIYLTIDSELTMAAYHILEQHIAGIITDKIKNIKDYDPESVGSDIPIPIYDVYFAVINNGVIDLEHLNSPKAHEAERAVYATYEDYKERIYDRLRTELEELKTPYKDLEEEFQVYQSSIVSLLNESGVIDQSKVDKTDSTYVSWVRDEVISLNEYLNFCIDQRWIDVNKLDMEEKYVDSSETFRQLTEYIISMVDNNTEFQKKLYHYMLLNDVLTGDDICRVLCEQKQVDVDPGDEEALYAGRMSAYQFMLNRILSLDITPAQLALDPCNGSIVIVDVKSGDVLALVSYPGYDNNMMANSVDAGYFAKLLADKSSPLLNYATQYKAAPGSTFKMVSATAGLNEGVINLGEKIDCVGTFTEVTPSPRCWSRRGHGMLDVVGGIQNSCNYFFYEVGFRLASDQGVYNDQKGVDILARYADLYGLSERSGVEISEYAPDVSDYDSVRSSIGQASNSYTAAGLARYVATVANGGTCYNLTLLDRILDRSGNVVLEKEPDVRNTVQMPGAYWDAIHDGMRKVVESKTYFDNLAIAVAGKTGTAQQIETRPNHALFVGYAPYESPEIAFSIRIPFGYSSDYAAHVAKDILKYYYGLADEDDLITGTANEENEGISMNEF